MPMPPGIRKTREQVITLLRTFIGDRPENNKLIPDFELGDDKLGLALDLAIDEFNNSPPFMQFTLLDFPSLMVLLHGATVQCLIMAGLIQSRNYLQYGDGGLSEVIGDKAPSYQGWITQVASIANNYKQMSSDIKVSVNMERTWGVIPSPYGDWFGGY